MTRISDRSPGKTVYKLFLLPLPETVSHLQDRFMNCPFEIHWDSLGIEIGSSLTKIETKSASTMYFAMPGGMDIWYDSSADEPQLLLPLFPSSKMAKRHAEIGDVWHRPQFRPVLSFGIAPTLRRRTRAFINSVATGLVDTSPVLAFHAETELVVEDCKYPAHGDFYRDYVGRGAVSNQVLLEQDEGIE